MVIVHFIVPDRVCKIRDGTQTFIMRKGIRPFPIGTTLHFYYKPQGRRGKCRNCINECQEEKREKNGYNGCSEWTNCYGKAPLVSIRYFPNGLKEVSNAELEDLAVKCGYPNLEDAIRWYKIKFGENWDEIEVSLLEWDCSKLVRE
jgi:hypothetical protein